MKNKTIPSYKNELVTLRNQLTEMLPTEALEIFDNDADNLGKNQSSLLKLKKGDKAPNFSLVNAIGETVTLERLLQKGKVILTFYRGTWCPYCNLQLNQYQQILPLIKEKGANLVAISPQTPDASLSIKEKNELAFQVLSDNGNIVAQKFTTVFKNGDSPVDAMAKLGYDYDGFYGDDSREIPVPAVFIIDKNSKIIFAETSGSDYRNRVESQKIINTLNL